MKIPAPFLIGAGAVAALAVAGVVLWHKRELFNPASDKNLAYQGAGGIVSSLTGGVAQGGEDTLGGYVASLYESGALLPAWVRPFIWTTDDKIEALKRGAPAPLDLSPRPSPYSINPRERT